MAVRERGGSFQADVKLGDVRHRETFKTREEAEAWELEARAAYKLGKPIPKPGGGQVKNAKIANIADLAAHCEKVHWRGKKASADLVRNAYLFVKWVGPKMAVAEALSAENIHEYVEYRQDEKMNAGATINRHLSSISVLCNYATELELIPKAPKMPWQEEGEGRLRFYSEQEEAQIAALVTRWGRSDVADLFTFLADTGFRVSEALRLEWQDIRGRAITVIAAHAKNKQTRTVTATSRVEAVLQRARSGPSGNAKGPFAGITRVQLRAIWNRLRIALEWMDEHTVIHTYRHTCASRLVQRGVDLYRVKQWMGHKSLTTTMRYAHLAPAHLEALADVLDGNAITPVERHVG